MPRNQSSSVNATHSGSHVAMRTCVGCRGQGSRSVLVRVVLEDGFAVIDESRAKPGRGAWLHRDPDCMAQALKRRAVGRALRAPQVDVSRLALTQSES